MWLGPFSLWPPVCSASGSRWLWSRTFFGLLRPVIKIFIMQLFWLYSTVNCILYDKQVNLPRYYHQLHGQQQPQNREISASWAARSTWNVVFASFAQSIKRRNWKKKLLKDTSFNFETDNNSNNDNMPTFSTRLNPCVYTNLIPAVAARGPLHFFHVFWGGAYGPPFTCTRRLSNPKSLVDIWDSSLR